jgi:hypothetical protein
MALHDPVATASGWLRSGPRLGIAA